MLPRSRFLEVGDSTLAVALDVPPFFLRRGERPTHGKGFVRRRDEPRPCILQNEDGKVL